jgi:hypothetical protein
VLEKKQPKEQTKNLGIPKQTALPEDPDIPKDSWDEVRKFQERKQEKKKIVNKQGTWE